jgi:hypothetical protein
VVYTVTDEAGNTATATRSVKVISTNLLKVAVDGQLTELNGTISITLGGHTLSVSNLPKASEPYTVTLVRGIWSEGQLKRVSEGIAVDDGGNFTLDEAGFYTLYILTQSRQSYRTLLYAE